MMIIMTMMIISRYIIFVMVMGWWAKILDHVLLML